MQFKIIVGIIIIVAVLGWLFLFGPLVAPQTAVMIGDVNGDHKVNCDDISITESLLGKTPGQYPFADVNANGVVDQEDINMIRSQLPSGIVCN